MTVERIMPGPGRVFGRGFFLRSIEPDGEPDEVALKCSLQTLPDLRRRDNPFFKVRRRSRTLDPEDQIKRARIRENFSDIDATIVGGAPERNQFLTGQNVVKFVEKN